MHKRRLVPLVPLLMYFTCGHAEASSTAACIKVLARYRGWHTKDSGQVSLKKGMSNTMEKLQGVPQHFVQVKSDI